MYPSKQQIRLVTSVATMGSELDVFKQCRYSHTTGILLGTLHNRPTTATAINVRTGKALKKWQPTNPFNDCFVYLDTLQLFVTGNALPEGSQINFYKLSNLPKPYKTLTCADEVKELEWLFDDNLITFIGNFEGVRVLDLNTLELTEHLGKNSGVINLVQMHLRGRSMLVTHGADVGNHSMKYFCVFDLKTGQYTKKLTEDCYAIEYVPIRNSLLYATESHIYELENIHDLSDSQKPKELHKIVAGYLSSFYWPQNSKRLLFFQTYGPQGDQIHVVDLEAKKVVEDVELPKNEVVNFNQPSSLLFFVERDSKRCKILKLSGC